MWILQTCVLYTCFKVICGLKYMWSARGAIFIIVWNIHVQLYRQTEIVVSAVVSSIASHKGTLYRNHYILYNTVILNISSSIIYNFIKKNIFLILTSFHSKKVPKKFLTPNAETMNNIWGSGGPFHLSCFFQLKDYILKSISFVKKYL